MIDVLIRETETACPRCGGLSCDERILLSRREDDPRALLRIVCQCSECGEFERVALDVNAQLDRAEMDEPTPETDPDDPRDPIVRSIDRELRRQYGEDSD